MPHRISALLPTADRRRFIPACLAQFLAQNRDDAELVILDDDDPVADLTPGDPRIRYHREDAWRVLGDMRNRLCALACGYVLIHWDDETVTPPTALAASWRRWRRAVPRSAGFRRSLFLPTMARVPGIIAIAAPAHWSVAPAFFRAGIGDQGPSRS